MIDQQIYPPDHAPGDCTGGCDDIKLAKRRLEKNGERMSSIEGAINVVHQRLAAHDEKIHEIHADILKNNSETSEVLGIVQTGKGFFKALGWIAEAFKWVAGLALPVIGVYLAIKEGLHK